MFAYLKRKKKLNTANLRQLLVPVIEHLDFDGVYITDGIIKTVCRNCPNLRMVILKDCGYVVTDSVVETLLRVSTVKSLQAICVAPNTRLRTCVMKIAHIQGKSPNVVIVIFHTLRNHS